MEKGNERVAFFFYNESILSFFFIWKDLISEEYSPPPPSPFTGYTFPMVLKSLNEKILK